MKILFIGGTGLISSACSALAVEKGYELFILNRSLSSKYPVPPGARLLTADVHRSETALVEQLSPFNFDAVVDWIAYTPADIARDIRLFAGKTRQFVFISSASVYQKPPEHYRITEETPLSNPLWEYSRNKIACEQLLMQAYRQQGFPVTLIRPSLTYGPSQIPLSYNSWQHPYTVIDRIKRGKEVIIPGDGTSLWTLTWHEDFAVGFLGLLGREDALGEAFHLTSDEVLCWNQIYREVGLALGVTPRFLHIASDLIVRYDPEAVGSLIGDKNNSSVFDNSKIRSFVPEFKPVVPWSEGLRRALAWHAADPSRQTIDEQANQIWDRLIADYRRVYPDE
jgi:nucleoside-diphosphate-sugar epimerase